MEDFDFEKEKESFLDYLRVERGLAGNSISSYGRDLTRFGVYVESFSLKFYDLEAKHLRDYQSSLRSDGLANSSVSRAMSALRTFYLYLSKEYGINNPTADLEKSKQIRRLPKALTVQEISDMIDSSWSENDPVSLRERSLLELLYGTGGRVSEIVGLDLADIYSVEAGESEVETVKLQGKGGKERLVPLGSYASAALKDYLVRVRPLLAQRSSKPSKALFLNQRGTRLSRQSAWKFVLDAAHSAGISNKVSPHVFRHSFATHLLDGGADIRVVQELLGHASVTTTQIYTLITIDKIRESYSTAHPRARD